MNVIEANFDNARDIERMIAGMREAGLTDALVLGYDKDGNFWSDVNFVDAPTALWLMEIAKAVLIRSALVSP